MPRGKLRWIFASFVLELGQAVPERRLIEQVWGPSGASSAALRSATSRLRGWLAESGLSGHLDISHTGTAYVMTARDTLLDADRAASLLGRSGEEPDDEAQRLDRLIEAAELWREPVLADAPPGLRHHPVAAELDHVRNRCVVELAELACRRGQSALVLGILRRAARDAPYDEPVQAAFITAAHLSGLRTEALRHYDTVCRYLTADLGVSPSPILLAAARALRRSGGRTPAGSPPQSILPPEPAGDFSGRGRELGLIQRALTDADGPSLMHVTGAPGVGKTELCRRAAAGLRTRGFERILYAEMGGSTPDPVSPHDVVARFVRAMDPSGRADGSDDPAAAAERYGDRYQELLGRHRTLIVLDDVAGPVQLAGLLPRVPGCRTLANGRARAWSGPECSALELCALSLPAGISLLAAMIGGERIERSRDAVESIFIAVDGHPAALRIAGLRLAARPRWRPEDLADRLRDHRNLMGELRHDNVSLRDVFAHVCGRLDAATWTDLARICSAAPRDRAGAFSVPRAELPGVPDDSLYRLRRARLIVVLPGERDGQDRVHVPNLVRALCATAGEVVPG